MFNSSDDLKKVARSLTHYVYRNTKLENYHVENAEMNDDVYKTMYKTVYANLKNVKLLHKYVFRYEGSYATPGDVKKLISSVPEELQFKFIRYIQYLIDGFSYGSAWDEAVTLELPAEKQSLASYVLAGKFKEYCDNHICLDDNAMCRINKDVHNRIYTLLVSGYFN